MKIRYIIFIFFSILLSQAEYQIITSPKNIFQLSSSGGLSSLKNSNNYNNPAALQIYDKQYGFSFIQYPANITMYNFTIKNYSISILDYGLFEDRLHDILYKTFSAKEIMLQYFYNYNIRNLRFGISMGLYHSHIYNYNAFGLVTSIGLNIFFERINSSLALSIENFGYTLKHYTAYNLSPPLKYRIGLNKNFKSFTIGYDMLYSKTYKDFQHILCFEFLISDKVKLRLSNTDYIIDLLVDGNDYNFLSGLAIGMNVDIKPISLDIGFMNLGISGMAYGVSINFIGD